MLTGLQGVLFWVITAAVLLVIEGMTVQLVCVWFAFGSVFALIASALGASFAWQLGICIVFSVAFLFIARPIFLKKLKPKPVATNADMVVGMTGLVTGQIDNINDRGRVLANGLEWTARSQDGDIIDEGNRVNVCKIDGVKLIVTPVPGEHAE